MKGRGARTYLVKELVLSKVPDVLRLLHGRDQRRHRKAPLVAGHLLRAARVAGSQHPVLGVTWRALVSGLLGTPSSDPGANVIPCQPARLG